MEISRLKKIRKRFHWSQEDLARALGVSTFTVNRWERGVKKPSYKSQRLVRDFVKKNASV